MQNTFDLSFLKPRERLLSTWKNNFENTPSTKSSSYLQNLCHFVSNLSLCIILHLLPLNSVKLLMLHADRQRFSENFKFLEILTIIDI